MYYMYNVITCAYKCPHTAFDCTRTDKDLEIIKTCNENAGHIIDYGHMHLIASTGVQCGTFDDAVT